MKYSIQIAFQSKPIKLNARFEFKLNFKNGNKIAQKM